MFTNDFVKCKICGELMIKEPDFNICHFCLQKKEIENGDYFKKDYIDRTIKAIVINKNKRN